MIVRLLLVYILIVLVVFGCQIVIRSKVQRYFDPEDIDEIFLVAGQSFCWPFILAVALIASPFALVYVIAYKVAKRNKEGE